MTNEKNLFGDAGLPPELIEKWNNIIAAINSAKYSYIFSTKLHYEGDDDPNNDYSDISGKKKLPGSSVLADVTFNEHTTAGSLSKHLSSLVDDFQSQFLMFVDDTSYSVGQRLQFFLDCKEKLLLVEKKVFFKQGDHVNRNNLVEQQGEEYIYHGYIDEKYHFAILEALQAFVIVQYHFHRRVSQCIEDVVQFIPNKLVVDNDNIVGNKLDLKLNRSELIVLLTLLRKCGIINKSTTNYELSKFSESNFLLNQNSVKSLMVLFSQFNKLEKVPDNAVSKIHAKLESLIKTEW